MRFIPTHIHAIMDYCLGVLTIAAPWLFGFAAGGPETWLLVIAGLGLIAYSLFTDYEYSLSRALPMRTHLAMDVAVGVVLLLCAWLIEMGSTASWTFAILGILEIGAGLMTRSVPHSAATTRTAAPARPEEHGPGRHGQPARAR